MGLHTLSYCTYIHHCNVHGTCENVPCEAYLRTCCLHADRPLQIYMGMVSYDPVPNPGLHYHYWPGQAVCPASSN